MKHFVPSVFIGFTDCLLRQHESKSFLLLAVNCTCHVSSVVQENSMTFTENDTRNLNEARCETGLVELGEIIYFDTKSVASLAKL